MYCTSSLVFFLIGVFTFKLVAAEDCMQLSICDQFPKDVCVDPMVQKDCPKLCNKCDVGKDCGDVSKYCKRSLNCNKDIYKIRCRKSCNLCNAPLPARCKGLVDQDMNCSTRAANSDCRKSAMTKKECPQSCCLRGEM